MYAHTNHKTLKSIVIYGVIFSPYYEQIKLFRTQNVGSLNWASGMNRSIWLASSWNNNFSFRFEWIWAMAKSYERERKKKNEREMLLVVATITYNYCDYSLWMGKWANGKLVTRFQLNRFPVFVICLFSVSNLFCVSIKGSYTVQYNTVHDKSFHHFFSKSVQIYKNNSEPGQFLLWKNVLIKSFESS